MIKQYIYLYSLSLSFLLAQDLFKTHPYGKLGYQKNLTSSIGLGDLDQDGDIDLVIANGRHWAEQNIIFFNDGKGFFRRSKNLGSESNTSYQAPVVDIDNDGDLDILVANDRILNQVFMNDGNGNLIFEQYFGKQESNTRGLCVADLNNDGFVDVAVANRKSQNYIYFNDGKGHFNNALPFGSKDEATIKIASGDMNGDNYIDIVLANRNGQPNRIYFGPTFKESSIYGTGKDETRGVVVNDMDGDNYLDIISEFLSKEKSRYSPVILLFK